MSETSKKRKSKSDRLYERINESHALAMLKSQEKIKNLYPYERLRGTGYGFFVNFETKEMVKITLGRQIYRITENADKHGRHLVMAENQTIIVPQELIEELGYN